ncbi:hypothetical protein Tco_0799594 [Tanacetum coccineum]|uniref:Uncharacterized protein n=1 Tax=Tanacetum coccineum TaxID=301880 RepID=A0ABQ4ZTF0_9ASTR
MRTICFTIAAINLGSHRLTTCLPRGSHSHHPHDFVPEPMYPEYMPLEDEILLAEEQPLPAAASPTVDSPGYVHESDSEEEPEADDDEDPEEDPADYPTNRAGTWMRRGGERAPKIWTGRGRAVLAVTTPPPSTTYPTIIYITTDYNIQILSPPLPASPPASVLPALPLPTSSAPLQLLSSDRRADRPEITLPSRKRLGIDLGLRCEVGESSATAAARPIGGRWADYGFVDTVDAEINRRRAEEEAWGRSMEVSYMAHSEIMALRSIVMSQQTVASDHLRDALSVIFGLSVTQVGLTFYKNNTSHDDSKKVASDHLRDALSVIFGLSVTQDTVMSDSEDSTVTYTQISSPFADLSDIGSPRVDGPPIMPDDPYAYVVAAFQAPPSPDYVPGLEEPHAPLLLDFVLEPVYSEFMPPDVEVLPAEEQPLHAVASPTDQSPGYIPESDPEEELEEDDEDPEEDPADYPTDRDDDDDEEEEEQQYTH